MNTINFKLDKTRGFVPPIVLSVSNQDIDIEQEIESSFLYKIVDMNPIFSRHGESCPVFVQPLFQILAHFLPFRRFCAIAISLYMTISWNTVGIQRWINCKKIRIIDIKVYFFKISLTDSLACINLTSRPKYIQARCGSPTYTAQVQNDFFLFKNSTQHQSGIKIDFLILSWYFNKYISAKIECMQEDALTLVKRTIWVFLRQSAFFPGVILSFH